MRAGLSVHHEFVETIPETLEANTVYVSIPFATAVHRCMCGCGAEVVTPLSPHGWELTFDGVSISLHPSIGNWGFACHSHYWVRRNKVVWAPRWSPSRIDGELSRDPNGEPPLGFLRRARSWWARLKW